MKFFEQTNTLDAPWDKVAPAILRKYPNPFNSHCKTIDVVDRQVDKNGILKTHRIMGAYWDICGLGKHILGNTSSTIGCEHTEVDPKRKVLKQETTNVTFSNLLTIHEKYKYIADPKDPNKTLQKCYTEVNVFPYALGFFETIIRDSVASNAKAGLSGLQWVVQNLDTELNMDTL